MLTLCRRDACVLWAVKAYAIASCIAISAVVKLDTERFASKVWPTLAWWSTNTNANFKRVTQQFQTTAMLPGHYATRIVHVQLCIG